MASGTRCLLRVCGVRACLRGDGCGGHQGAETKRLLSRRLARRSRKGRALPRRFGHCHFRLLSRADFSWPAISLPAYRCCTFSPCLLHCLVVVRLVGFNRFDVKSRRSLINVLFLLPALLCRSLSRPCLSPSLCLSLCVCLAFSICPPVTRSLVASPAPATPVV